MESQLPELLKILTLTKNDDGTFIGRNLFIGSPNVYGGQVLAQAVAAANATVSDGKILHSLHSYFINPGDNDAEIR